MTARSRRRPDKSRETRALLRRLAAARTDYGPGAAQRTAALLDELRRTTMPTPQALVALHEGVLFVRAYPAGREVVVAADALLAAIPERRELKRWRTLLADSGIVGTAIRYPFFFPTATWLAARFPERLTLDWESLGDGEELRPLLDALPPGEAVWGRERRASVRAVLRAASARRGGEATALLERLASMPGDGFSREALHDRVGPTYLLAPGPGTPNRSLARASGSPMVLRSSPPPRDRPDLQAELERPPRAVRTVSVLAGGELIALARDAMVTRARDLDNFAYGDPRDVRRFRHDDGLELIAIGTLPERRLLLASTYGLLAVRNGVPTGYVQLDGFLDSVLVHFNTFETFRGADAGWVFSRVLATARALFGGVAFAIDPYQLGQKNDEALDSGAWWFYRKLGFRPLAPEIAALAEREAVRLRRHPGERTSRETLEQLASSHVVWEPLGRAATIPPHAAISCAIAEMASEADGAVGRRALVERAAALVGLGRGQRLSADERLWLERWAPMLLAIPDFEAWSPAERAEVGTLVRAKAARFESELPRLWAAHSRFAAAVLALAARHGAASDLRPHRS